MNFTTKLFSFGAVGELPSSATIRPFRGPLRSRTRLRRAAAGTKPYRHGSLSAIEQFSTI